MELKQKLNYLNQINPFRTNKKNESKSRKAVSTSLPKLQSHFKYKKIFFKDYMMGSKFVNEIPLLIFRSECRKTPNTKLFQRYKTQQIILNNLDVTNPQVKKDVFRAESINSQPSIFSIYNRKVSGLHTLSVNSVSIGQNLSKLGFKPKNRANFAVSFVKRHSPKKPRNVVTEKDYSQFITIEDINIEKKYIRLRKESNKDISKVKNTKSKFQKKGANEEQVGPWVNKLQMQITE